MKFNPAKSVAEIIETLSPRLRDVIRKRYGLKDGQRRTLEAIGKEMGITRERVRQIESDSFRQLRDEKILKKVEPLLMAFQNHLASHGNLRKETTFLEADLEQHLDVPSTPEQKAAVCFLLILGNKYFTRVPESDHWHHFWTTELQLVSTLPKLVEHLTDYFNQRRGLATFAEVKEAVEAALRRHLSLNAPSQAVQAYLGVMRPVGKNVFGHFGLVHWPEISPRGVRDKAYLVLSQAGRPIHFREIARAIDEAGFSNKKVHVQTVHNELIKDRRFVLVGRGTYGLAEWGYQAGIVRDVLVAILKKAGRPMSKEDIIREVLKQRQVKENTILLNLQNKEYFIRTSEGFYSLKG